MADPTGVEKGRPKDLSAALLDLDAGAAGPAPDAAADAAREQVRAVLRRDRRRVRVLTGVTVTLWLLAAGAVVWLTAVAYLYVLPRLEAAAFHPERLPAAAAPGTQNLHTYVLLVGATLLAVCVCVLSLATMSTLLLVLASRRATLRHVNAGLLQIADELKKLRAAEQGFGRDAVRDQA